MKGILLPCGISLLILGCAMLANGFKMGGDILEKCGITEENDATLHECLSDHMKRKMEAFENLKNSATRMNYTVIRQIFQESLKCFPEGKTKEKICYMSAGYRRPRPGMPKRGKDELSFGAASMYYQFRRTTKLILDTCGLTEKNSPKLFSCVQAIDPKAQEIIKTTKTDVRQGFEKMAKLISSTKACYTGINAKQGECLLEQDKVYQKNLTEQMHKHGKEMAQKLQKCGVNQEIIDTVMECTKPKADELIKLALQMFDQPEKAEEMWKLLEELKSCVRKYPEIKKCMMRGGYGRPSPRRQEKLSVNPFHFEQVTGAAMRYIQAISGSFIKRCGLDPRKIPNAFLCFKEKHDAEKDIDSKDPKKAFIAMMHLMNTTASCFDDVEQSKKECLAKGKDEMVKTINDNAAQLGMIVGKILKACEAPSDISGCVEPKEAKLKLLAKTLLTNPAIAEPVWNTGDSLKDCLKAHPVVEKCALSKNMSPPRKDDKSWHKKGDRRSQFNDGHLEMMQKHLKDVGLKMLADCKVTRESSPVVFDCLIKEFRESRNETSKDPKQIFLNGMKLIKSAIVCLKSATGEQKLCLAEKKKETQDMISEKSEMIKGVMDKMIEACGVSESKTPDLVKCYAPKRAEMEKLIPKMLNDPSVAETAWDLMVGVKKCFESKPEVMKCFKEKKSNYWMSKHGKGKYGEGKHGEGKHGQKPKMNFMERIGMVFKKCGVNPEKTPDLNKCLQPSVRTLTGLFYRRDLDKAGKMEEYKKLAAAAGKCFGDQNQDIKECLKKESSVLRSEFMERFAKESSEDFDPANAMASMDRMYSGCGITSDKTPELKGCLDERTRMVMQLKPWLPMSAEVREKLKDEGKKYWKCFADNKHSSQLKCMRKIIEGFRQQGKKAGSKPKDETPSVSDKDIQEIIDKTKAQFLACSNNKCFQEKVEASAEKFKESLEEFRAKKNVTEKFRRTISREIVGALFCLKKEPTKKKTFSCLGKVLRETSKNIKNKLAKMTPKAKKEEAVEEDEEKRRPSQPWKRKSRRSKRAVEDEDEETDFPFFPLPTEANSLPDNTISITMFEMIFNDKSIETASSLFSAMKEFVTTCNDWVPPPQAMRSRQIIDHGGLPARPPSDMFSMPEPLPTEPAGDKCTMIYDDIITFINTGQGRFRAVHVVSDNDKGGLKNDSVVIAVCTGGIAVGILILLTIIVIFVARRRCQKSGPCHQSALPVSATPGVCPVASCPPVYSTYPSKGMPEAPQPPCYSECLDNGVGFSQILSSSTSGEGTEKSC